MHSCAGSRPSQLITSPVPTDVCFDVSRRKHVRKKCYNNRAGRKREISVCVCGGGVVGGVKVTSLGGGVRSLLGPNITWEHSDMLPWTQTSLF